MRALARLTLIAAFTLSVIGLAACGGDDDEETVAPATTTEAKEGGGAGETLDVSLVDFEIEPANPSVKAGPVTFDVSNDGKTLHNLEVEGPAGEAELPEDLEPGDNDVLEVDLSEPGTYTWYCPVANHEQLGMKGEITVE